MSRARRLVRNLIVPVGMVGAILVLLAGGLVAAGLAPIELVARAAATLGSAIELVHLLLVITFAGAGLLVLRETAEPHKRFGGLVSTAPPPETPRNAPQLVGEEFDATVKEALRSVRLKDTAYSDTLPQQQLYATAHAGVKLAEGCDDEIATQILTAGEWTSDPLAEAFLSDTVAYPVRFQLLRWASPGEAYLQAIERTGSAVNRVLHEEAPTVSGAMESTAGTPNPGVIATIRAALRARMEAVNTDTQAADTPPAQASDATLPETEAIESPADRITTASEETQEGPDDV